MAQFFYKRIQIIMNNLKPTFSAIDFPSAVFKVIVVNALNRADGAAKWTSETSVIDVILNFDVAFVADLRNGLLLLLTTPESYSRQFSSHWYKIGHYVCVSIS